MGNTVMVCAIFVCLLALALLALAKPLQILFRMGLSAAAGGFVLFLGQSFGAAVGINAVTLLWSACLGIPGAVGLLVLSILL